MEVGVAHPATNELREAMTDDVAFRSWYDRVLPRVYAYLVARTRDGELAEELTQQVFIAAIDRRTSFDGRSDSVTWLCSIARHKLADHFRRLEREERRVARVVVREIELASPGDAWTAVESREAIASALASLPASQRAALIFVDLDELPVREAARLLRRSPQATQSLVTRARASFRAMYEPGVRDVR